MPIIAQIKGFKITMQYNDHNPPHIHIYKSSCKLASIRISDSFIVKGVENLSKKERKMLCEWTEKNKDILIDNWERVSKHQDIIVIPSV